MAFVAYRIEAGKGHDEIQVLVDNIEPGRGRLIVVCASKAWTAYWPAMGPRTLERFLADASDAYVTDYLMSGWRGSLSKKLYPMEHRYCEKIVHAVRMGFLTEVQR